MVSTKNIRKTMRRRSSSATGPINAPFYPTPSKMSMIALIANS
jgi:hypothetical protein